MQLVVMNATGTPFMHSGTGARSSFSRMPLISTIASMKPSPAKNP